MRLRRVAMTGFKTFAARSEVALEPGITAIVGPNGSGKSNLVDAIRWALGETNARELRGARMDEVIYSGGNGRGRMGFAEVELILDNEEGRLPVDDVEVSISRRVVRHGDSEYRLNGDRVRLRDLERVLGATGLTQSGYAVVAQNDIDAIIEASPAQRRSLVEQAAGVRSLRAASEDALSRVGGAETTLQRFQDLLAETEPRLAELAVQAGLALEQRQLTDQLSALRGSLAREAWRAARAQLRRAQRRLDAASSRREAAVIAGAAFSRRLEQHRAHLERRRSVQQEAGIQLEASRLDAERTRGELRRQADAVRAGVLQRARASVEARAAATDLAARLADLAQIGEAARAHPEVAERASAELVGATAGRDITAAAAAAAAERAVAAEAALRHAERIHDAADAALRDQATQLRVVREMGQTLDRGLAAGRQRITDLAEQADLAQRAHTAAADAVVDLEARHRARHDELEAARLEAAAASSALDEARDGARAGLARAATLRGQVEGALGGRGAIADAVDGRELTATRIVDSFTVADPGDRAAVEAALEHHLGAWIVDDVDAAAAHLGAGSAREELLHREPMAAAAVAPPAPPVRSALSAIHPGEGAAAVLAACLAGVWLCPDIALARATVGSLGGSAVLPDGTVLTATGRRGGGRPGRTLELAAAEHEAARVAAAATATEREADGRRRAAQEAAAAADAAERVVAEALQAARLGLVEASARVEAARSVLVAEQARVAGLEAEIAARRRERGVLDEAEVAARDALAAADRSRAEALAAAGSARETVQLRNSELAALAERVRAAETAVMEHAAAADAHERRLAVATEATDAASARTSAADLRVLDGELDVLAGLARCRALRRAARAADIAVEAAVAARAAAAPDLAAIEAAMAALEAERSDVAVVLARAQDEEAAAADEARTAAERVDELAEVVRDDSEDDGPEPEEGASERAEREIVRLERRIAGLGPVNALAPEEHQHLAARVARLREGRDDLGNACADIRALAARLVHRVDERFDAVFGAVSLHFHELFAELFPGGRATLRREEASMDAPPDDHHGDQDVPRPGGVEILAQPPGKRLQPLSLFSGGERALTALAVILALQQVNPSPFYLFDEVDAPLDDSNVLRFCRLLKRLSQGQQFIVVTHNHITMAAADALHGVTSDRDGVSSVISVRFDADAGETMPEADLIGLRQSTIRAAV